MRRHSRYEGPIDAAYVEYRLRHAGKTLMALPDTGHSPKLRLRSLEVIKGVEELVEAERSVPRFEPTAHDIAMMDEVFPDWLHFIPQSNLPIRRVIALRSLVSPVTDRHLWPWRRIGETMGTSHESARLWHARGVDMIIGGLARARRESQLPMAA
ncbi:conserved protein of unknown function (plasmid) [Rhodovastum atsumiense]|uniref:Uncharacterized protein n=1 Tax=Rhodovastum atsumiense TaxID=504468 RepID=A0A5M6IQ29_9PROT|nr:hypothetical protein [Rhodovastum atsumiense]KAA5609668.1 hypothetical protein F1189_23190 [Rhodovastum atsumiense]CAH2606431.1 conserved protein of unknown function [Rhodovastum atsumiense]